MPMSSSTYLHLRATTSARNAGPGSRGLGRCFAFCLALTALSVPAVQAAENIREELAGQDVTIIDDEDRTIYEFRQNGVLRMVKIVPAFGRPYFLVPADPTANQQDLSQSDRLVPSWKIVEF